MSSDSLNTDWLDVKSFRSVAARRFAEFCQQDFKDKSQDQSFDATLYQDACRFILERLEQAMDGDKA